LFSCGSNAGTGVPFAFTALAVALSPLPLAAQEGGGLALEEVVVVAQKREQSAMTVPVAVGTFTAQDMRNTGALTVAEIDDYIPGFDAGSTSTFTQQTYEIRGVSSPTISSGSDPSVATFYDEVYLPRSATTMAFNDMQRVEVLKGPQGTLFGRNASAGVINMIPTPPQEAFEAFARLRVGSEDLLRAEGMVNFAVTDDLFVRANVLANQRDGFVEQLGSADFDSGEQDHKTARVAALWEISDATRAQLAYDWDDVDQAPSMSIGFSPYAYSLDPFDDKAENDVINDEETRDMWAVTGKLWHEFSDGLSGKLILSYRDIETTNRQDEDGTMDATRYLDTDNAETAEVFYGEVQFNFTDERFDVVFGANYSSEDTSQTTWATALGDSITRLVTGELNSLLGLDLDHIWNADEYAEALNQNGIDVTAEEVEATGDLYYDLVASALGEPMVFGPSFAGVQWRERVTNKGDFEAWGLYADVDYKVTDRLSLLAGLRYSVDRKEFTWLIPDTTFAALRPGVSNQIFTLPEGFESAATRPWKADDDWNQTTGRLVAQYELTGELMTYLSYSTGYKSGGFDSLIIESSLTPIDPEESTQYEWGIKGDLVDGVLRAQLSLFRLEIEDRQRSVDSRPPGETNAIPTVINGDQTFDGVELTLDWLATDSLILGLVTTYREEEAEWDPFYNSDAELIREKTQGDTANNVTLKMDWTPAIPRGELLVHVDYIYRDNTRDTSDADYFPEYDFLPNYLDDEEYLNARVAWFSEGGHWEIALWGNNLLDTELITEVNNISRSAFGTPYVRINDPRMYGMDFVYTF
jgi:outer membrane receptor protein involved in Fe transport